MLSIIPTTLNFVEHTIIYANAYIQVEFKKK